METWVWVVIGVSAALVVAGAVVLALAFWRRVVRRHLRGLLGKREEARQLQRAFDELVAGLQGGSEEERATFADDPEAVERQSLADLHESARILAEEVNVMPLPSQLVPAAEALADAADILAEESERAGEGSIGDESLELLMAADRDRVTRAFAHADARLRALSTDYHLDAQEVYGRGL